MTLGQLCAALWDSRSRPGCDIAWIRTRVSVVSQLALRCSTLGHCLTVQHICEWMHQWDELAIQCELWRGRDMMIHHFCKNPALSCTGGHESTYQAKHLCSPQLLWVLRRCPRWGLISSVFNSGYRISKFKLLCRCHLNESPVFCKHISRL
jgi:hypothetical protein